LQIDFTESISLDNINTEFSRLEDICDGERTMHGEFALDWDVNGTKVSEGRAFDFAKLPKLLRVD
jgi:hypothetical protein